MATDLHRCFTVFKILPIDGSNAVLFLSSQIGFMVTNGNVHTKQ